MLMPGLAVACSVVLLLQHRARVFPVVALVASGLELLMSLGVVHLSVGSFPVSLVLGAALLVGGVGVYVKASAKPVVSAATVVTLLGLLQVLAGLHLRLL
jgi:hypothetical protein